MGQKVLHCILALTMAFLAALAGLACAQTEDVGEVFKKVSEQERGQLQAILDEPVPPAGALNTTLEQYFARKQSAAIKLGDLSLLLGVYKQWLEVYPANFNYNNYANELMRSGNGDEALRIRKLSLERASKVPFALFQMCNYAGDLFALGRFDEAQQTLDEIRKKLEQNPASKWKNRDLTYYRRAEAKTYIIQSDLDRRLGRFDKAIENAAKATVMAKEIVKITKNSVADNDMVTFSAKSMVDGLNAEFASLKAVGRFSDAEERLRQFQAFTKQVRVEPFFLITMYTNAAGLRFDLREFKQAENYYRKADQVAASMAYTPTTRNRMGIQQAIIGALAGQQRWNDAMAELQRFDTIAKNEKSGVALTSFPLERGYVYLQEKNKNAEAIALFEGLTKNLSRRYPAHHFFIAQAQGLHAVALSRSGIASNQTKALGLIKQSVADYMLPANLDFQSAGLGKDIRELIFATYLESIFATPAENAIHTMGPADWIRGGMVQEAVADAAVRSAASERGLSDLVRQDQDAKNEITTLRKYLADNTGEAGESKLLSADTVVKMRSRVATLDAARQSLQTEIKSKFPDYDRLVHPAAPTVDDIAAALAQDEALVMLLPTTQAVYVWAVSRDGKHIAYRVALPEKKLSALVKSTRATLDLGEMGNRLLPFNAAASQELYASLLGPAQAVIGNKQHLIFAPGGSLGQIPFAVLLTKPGKTLGNDAPWLIRQAAITQIPSLSAWLAIKQFSKTGAASEALAAWGDPLFSQQQHSKSSERNASATLELDDPAAAFNYGDIPALPDTRDELLSIAQALQADPKNDLHLGASATKQSVLQSSTSGQLHKKRVLVFATHGLIAGDLPNLNQPALALATTEEVATNPLAALLTLDDVLRLKLNADWVVLSACNTAASDGKGEEAMSGLARGFFYAGSRSLLVTHWSVDSASAKELTTATFSHRAAHPTERKAESLRQAMLQVMAKPQQMHPAYWAPYALVGDGDR